LTAAAECSEMRRTLGVYVVGAIAPGDRSAVESHLSACAGCRAELAGMAGLPGLLGRVSADEATVLLCGDDRPEPLPAQPLQSLLGMAGQLRRRALWPRLAAAAMAGLLVGGAAIVASRALSQSAPGAPAVAAQLWTAQVHGNSPSTHAAALVKYAAQPWGLELDVQVHGIPAGTLCELQVINAAGQDVAAGSWTVAGGHEGAWYPGSSSVPLSGVRGFVIKSGARTLVTIPLR
jgi:hypothetical protein